MNKTQVKKLLNSDIVIKKNCRVVAGFVYERLRNHPLKEKYRVFFSDDDYDYVDRSFMVKLLDYHFKRSKS